MRFTSQGQASPETATVAYCGLYCAHCSSRTRVSGEASTLRDPLRHRGDEPGFFDVTDLDSAFPVFWQALELLAETPCSGCREGGGPADCAIRSCARIRLRDAHFASCPFCEEFPCPRLERLSHHPQYLVDARRLRQIGPAAWVEEQDARGS